MKNNKKIIGIFGGSSFLARYTIEKLCKEGYRLKIGTRKPWLVNNLKTLGYPGQLELMPVNIFNPNDVKKILKNCDYCINFCGQLFEGKISFDQLHTRWPEILSQISHENKIKKLIHISALNKQESNPSKYMQSKMKGEEKIKKNIENYFILRPSLIFGNGDDKFFSTFGTMAEISPIIPLPGGGKTIFSPVHASDCAEAIVKILELGNQKKRIFEIAGSKNYTFKNLIEIFLKEIKKKKFLISVPFGVIKIQSYFLQYFPQPFKVTPDQIILLQHNSILSGKFPTLKDLNIKAKDLESVFKFWKRWRVGGEFG
jgi:uncharacterized protein YbjT (DUF2867 family)